ncbi:ECF transporter S component [Arthrobacter crusticola]|uniref:ECF transporter S component n=1 Tax=Arthrobacter crusticola TaxID=2547960 RepID=A0A4R5TTE7_9MICC|nr:general stress protein [Arthrobacter crusticola]TDK23626.1 ECF transporter S component [Arthrobacter crusticola]
MANVLGRTPSRDEGRALPRGETVGRYTAYLEAQKAVDYLADNKFPVERVSIIGNDLKTVERVTGRLSYPRVALASAATGAWFGFFVGLILTLFGGSEPFTSVLSSMALGAMFWLLFGVITYAFQRGKRDFTSTNQVIATSYDVIVDPSVAGEARRRLQQLPMNGQALHPGGPAGGWDRPAGGYQPPAPLGGVPGPEVTPGPAGPDAGTPAPAGPGGAPGDPAGPRRGKYPDLPDGRPQYGIRVDTPVQEEVPRAEGPAGVQPPAAEPEGPVSDGPAGEAGQHGSTRVEPPRDGR